MLKPALYHWTPHWDDLLTDGPSAARWASSVSGTTTLSLDPGPGWLAEPEVFWRRALSFASDVMLVWGVNHWRPGASKEMAGLFDRCRVVLAQENASVALLYLDLEPPGPAFWLDAQELTLSAAKQTTLIYARRSELLKVANAFATTLGAKLVVYGHEWQVWESSQDMTPVPGGYHLFDTASRADRCTVANPVIMRPFNPAAELCALQRTKMCGKPIIPTVWCGIEKVDGGNRDARVMHSRGRHFELGRLFASALPVEAVIVYPSPGMGVVAFPPLPPADDAYRTGGAGIGPAIPGAPVIPPRADRLIGVSRGVLADQRNAVAWGAEYHDLARGLGHVA